MNIYEMIWPKSKKQQRNDLASRHEFIKITNYKANNKCMVTSNTKAVKVILVFFLIL
jgi:hypothetical protein